MRRISYADVLAKVEAKWTLTEGELSVTDQAAARVFINSWAATLWEKFWWPEWLVCAARPRRFRQPWASGTAYGAPTASAAVEVFHVRSRKYAQSLVAANTGNAPFNDSGVENSAYWAECRAAYTGNDYAAGPFTVGTIVRNPDDDRFYQCHTAHNGGAALDATKFGILTPFRRSLDYEQSWEETPIGTVRAIWPQDPRVCPGGADLEFTLADAIYVTGCEAEVWPEFLERPPTWTGDAWANGTTYAADAQVYDSDTGDFYRSLAGGNQGNPVTDTTRWERIDFPWVLREPVAHGVFAELLAGDEQEERAIVARRDAMKLAEEEFTLLMRQQRQARRLPMRMP